MVLPTIVALMVMTVSDSDLRSLYVTDSKGQEHFLGPATSASVCERAAKAALLDRPIGIKHLLGPPPWRFECRQENRFAPGWDQIKGRGKRSG
jgi:hypothetical protein